MDSLEIQKEFAMSYQELVGNVAEDCIQTLISSVQPVRKVPEKNFQNAAKNA